MFLNSIITTITSIIFMINTYSNGMIIADNGLLIAKIFGFRLIDSIFYIRLSLNPLPTLTNTL